ncbi:YraN family protein [Candidatus Uhrbacteria bacterium]|nr:YraN family protein [Candidatus Uhrbacteria bacterium]
MTEKLRRPWRQPSRQSSTRQLGQLGEDLALRFLLSKGFRLVDRNWHCRYGEIDLIMTDGPELVFVEVKLRSGSGFGHPEEAVNYFKLKKFRLAVSSYLSQHRCFNYRIDVVTVVLVGRKARVSHLINVGL